MFSSPQKKSVYPLRSRFHIPVFYPWQPLHFLPMNLLLFWLFYINKIICYFVLFDTSTFLIYPWYMISALSALIFYEWIVFYCVYVPSFVRLFICLYNDGHWTVFTFRLLWIILWWTRVYMYLFEYQISIFVCVYWITTFMVNNIRTPEWASTDLK